VIFPALLDLPLDPAIAVHPIAHRVYVRLLSLLDFHEPRPVKQWVIAEELFANSGNVGNAFDLLAARGFIKIHGREGKVRLITLVWSRPIGSSSKPHTKSA
jgi:hypothetical protein